MILLLFIIILVVTFAVLSKFLNTICFKVGILGNQSTHHMVKSREELTVFHGVVTSWPCFSYKINRDTCRLRVLIGNIGAMYFNAYLEPYNHAHSLHVYFWYNLGTMYSTAYPELYKHGHSLLVYFSHNLGTIHTMWVFLDWVLSRSAGRYGYMNAW